MATARKITITHADVMRSRSGAGVLAAIRDGRVQRAATIPARKGPGSYRRREKHRPDY